MGRYGLLQVATDNLVARGGVDYNGVGYVVLGPSISFAQYPGSAGNLNDGAFGESSSASSDPSSGASSTSGSVKNDETSKNSPAVPWPDLILMLAGIALTGIMVLKAGLSQLRHPEKMCGKDL